MNHEKQLFLWETEDNYLTLDPAVINEKRQDRKSVTDEYEVRVFTNTFREGMLAAAKGQEQELLEKQIFVKKMEKNESMRLEDVMFQNPVMTAEIGHNIPQTDRTPSYAWVIGAAFVCFAVFLYRYQKQGRNVYDYNNQSEVGES